MDKAVFGVDRRGGDAVYTGTSGGQLWLQGSAPAFCEDVKGRMQLDRFFPKLHGDSDSMFGRRRNQEGVLHLQLRRGRLYVVLVFQPSYSLVRSIPLWLCARMSHEELCGSAALSSVVAALVRERQRIATDSTSPVNFWCRSEESMVGRGTDVLEASRAVREIIDGHLRTGNTDLRAPAVDDRIRWDAWQKVLAAIAQGAPDGNGRFSLSVALEEPAILGSGPEDFKPDLFLLSSVSASAGFAGWSSRGVADGVILDRVDFADALRSGIERLIAACGSTPSPGAWPTLGELVAHEVPFDLVPESELEPHEYQVWAEAIWASTPEDLVGRRIEALASSDMRQQLGSPRAASILTELMVASPAARIPGADLKALEKAMRSWLLPTYARRKTS